MTTTPERPETTAALFDLTDRVAIVTGGSRGIGRAIAVAYADLGAKVVVASRKAEACEEAAPSIVAAGGDAFAVPTHVGDGDAVEALVAATVARYGGIDIVVNNAATAVTQPVGAFTREAFTKVLDVNLLGPVFLTQAALPHLERSEHASVVNVISVGAFLFSAGTAMYSAAKAALLSITRSSAAELAPKGVRLNALAPGAVDTDMVRNTGEEGAARMRGASLQKRIAAPWELAGAAVFLAGDASTFVTGQVLLVDGGMHPH